jgi:excinuclease ABC subunit B
MERAISETNRRRKIQDDYNKAHGIVPKTVVKGIRDIIDMSAKEDKAEKKAKNKKLTAKEREALIEKLTREMKDAARQLEFEKAAYLRDEIKKLREK